MASLLSNILLQVLIRSSQLNSCNIKGDMLIGLDHANSKIALE